MGIIRKNWLTVASLISVLILATACFQQVGDQAQGPAVSIAITDTPEPTQTPEPTEEPTEATAVDLPISNNPTATETPTDTVTPLAVAQAGGTATVDPNDFSQRATQLVEDATGTAVAPLTLTASVVIGFTDTPTPTLAPLTDNTTTTTNFISGVDCVHEVRAGETMYSYSRYYGIPVVDIATRNGIVNPNIISIGQMLTIPGCGTNGVLPPPTSVPTATLTPFLLNTQFGQGGTDLNNNANLGQGGSLVTTNCTTQYTVQQYDTLFQISITYGVAAQSIANANGILNLGRIDMGDVLCIPSQ